MVTCKQIYALTPAETAGKQQQSDSTRLCCNSPNVNVHEDGFSQKPRKRHQ